MKRKWLLFSIIILMVVNFTTGCGSSQKDEVAIKNQDSQQKKPEENNKEPFTIRIPDTVNPGGVWHPYIADAKGFFEKEGLKAKFTGVISPGNNIAAVIKGDNHVGGYHIPRPIVSRTVGGKVKVVVNTTLTTKDSPHMTYAVLENSPIIKPQDLVGKKIGVITVG